MNADIITDTSHPHGTVEGFRGGCTTGHCPSEVSCSTVHTRWAGDYAFRKQLDNGMTAIDIVTQEREQAEETARAAKEARMAATRHAATIRYNEARRRARASRERHIESPHNDTIIRLHTEGRLDSEIAEHLGLGRRQVTTLRDSLGLKPNRGINTDMIRTLHQQGLTDNQIADHINEHRARKANRRAIAAVRLRLGLAPNPAPATTTGASSIQEDA